MYHVFLIHSSVNGCFPQMAKNLPAMQETWVRSLGWENPMEEGMATHFSILAWRIPKDRRVWWGPVYGIAKSQTQLSNKAQLLMDI